MSEQFTKSKDNQIKQNGLIMSTDEVVDYLNTANNAIGSLSYENAQLRKELNDCEKFRYTRKMEEIYNELGVLMEDPLTCLMVTTMKQDFWGKFKDLELHEAWECFVDEINRVNTIIELHDELVAKQWVGDLNE